MVKTDVCRVRVALLNIICGTWAYLGKLSNSNAPLEIRVYVRIWKKQKR